MEMDVEISKYELMMITSSHRDHQGQKPYLSSKIFIGRKSRQTHLKNILC